MRRPLLLALFMLALARASRLRALRPLRGGSDGASSDWSAHTTDEGQTYYYNSLTGESTWDPPAGWQQTSAPQPHTAQLGWSKHYTEDGTPYYYNAQTDESSWDAPPDLSGQTEAATEGGTGNNALQDDDVSAQQAEEDTIAPVVDAHETTGAYTAGEMDPAADEATLEEQSTEAESFSGAGEQATSGVESSISELTADATQEGVSEEAVGGADAGTEAKHAVEPSRENNTKGEEPAPDVLRPKRKASAARNRKQGWWSWCCGGIDEDADEAEQPGEGPLGEPRTSNGETDGRLGTPAGLDMASHKEAVRRADNAEGALSAAQSAAAQAEAEAAELRAALAASNERESDACEQLKRLDARVAAEEESLVRIGAEAEEAAARAEAEAERADVAEAAAAAAETARAEAEEMIVRVRKELGAARQADAEAAEKRLAAANAELQMRKAEAEKINADLQAARQEVAATAARVAELEIKLSQVEAAASEAAEKCAADLHAREDALSAATSRANAAVERADDEQKRAAEADERARMADERAALAERLAEEARTKATSEEARAAEAAKEAQAARAAAEAAESAARAAVAQEVDVLRSKATEAETAAISAQAAADKARREAAEAASQREQAQAEFATQLVEERARAADGADAAARALADREAALQASSEAASRAQHMHDELQASQRAWSARCDALTELRYAAEQDVILLKDRARAGALRIEASVLGLQAASLRRYSGAYINRAHRSTVATAAFREFCALMPHVCDMVHGMSSTHASGEGLALEGVDTETTELLADHTAIASRWRRLAALVQPMPDRWRLQSRMSAALVHACEDNREIAISIADLTDVPRARPERSAFFEPRRASAEVVRILDDVANTLQNELRAPGCALEWLIGAGARAARPVPPPPSGGMAAPAWTAGEMRSAEEETARTDECEAMALVAGDGDAENGETLAHRGETETDKGEEREGNSVEHVQDEATADGHEKQ